MATISGRAPVVCAFVAGMALAATAAAAQVTLDGSANRDFSGPLRPKGGEFRIGARLGRLAGKNLFHSFEQFDLREGERATFRGPAQVANIISRVTGGEPSDIDGTIRSTIEGADFYFLNPAGVVFGPNASLDLKGSFHVSTADELRFADGAFFSARTPDTSSFTVAAPGAFGFLGPSPAPILVDRSRLAVLEGQAFSIVGGDVTVTDRNQGAADIGNPNVAAPDGRLTLLAVDGRGEGRPGSGQIDGKDGAAVTVTQQAMLSTIGAEGGGRMRIRGGAISLDRGAFATARTVGPMASGGIRIDGDSVTISDAEVNAATRGEGRGGVLRITADDSVDIGQDGSLITNSFGSGDAGDVSVHAPDVTLNGALIQAAPSASGAGGAITITADQLHINGRTARVSTQTTGTGAGGHILLRVGSLTLSNGAQVFTSSLGDAAGGNITITAQGGVYIADLPDGLQEFATGLFTSTGGPGASGRITITADQLVLRDFAVVVSETTSSGVAGDIDIEVRVLEVINGGFVTTGTTGSGDAGAITVTAAESATFRGGMAGEQLSSLGADSQIFEGAATAPADLGDAGSIRVTTPLLILDDDGQMVSRTDGGGAGGNITVSAHDIFVLDSGAISSVTRGSGDAGPVRVNTTGAVLIAGRDSGLFLNSLSPDPEAGRVGPLRLRARRLEVLDGGLIESARLGGVPAPAVGTQADAIRVVANELVLNRGAIESGADVAGGGRMTLLIGSYADIRDGQIVTSVFGGEDSRAGDVLIRSPLVILDGGHVVAQATEGRGGNIDVVADTLLVPEGNIERLIARGDLSASAGPAGISGSVSVDAPEMDVSGGLVVLEGALLDAASQLRERCGARRDVGASSFTGVGRDGLPSSPDGPLGGSYARAGGREAPALGDGSNAQLAATAANAAFEAATDERRDARTAELATLAPCRRVL